MMNVEADRQSLNILVPEAHALGAIAVIRSLGRAGYRVHACSSDRRALGLRSNFAWCGEIIPSYDNPAFIRWLRAYIRDQKINGIVPSEGFLHAIHDHFDEFRHLMPVPQNRHTAFAAFSKIDVMKALTSASEGTDWHQHLPPSIIVERGRATPSVDDIHELGAPFFLKGDARDHRHGHEALIQRLETAEAAQAALIEALESYDALLLQGWVGGVKAAASFCLDHKDGMPVAVSGVLGLRTTPHQGGMMTCRQSWNHDKMCATAKAWLHRMGWRGVAMVECKWDPETDQFWLIEINARFWGYLHLDLFSGVDMPRIQMDRFFGLGHEPAPRQKLGVRCRHTLPGDASFLISLLKDPSVGRMQKARAIVRFLADFTDPRLHSDLLFPGDRHLYWHQAGQYISDTGKRLYQRLRAAGGHQTTTDILKPAE